MGTFRLICQFAALRHAPGLLAGHPGEPSPLPQLADRYIWPIG